MPSSHTQCVYFKTTCVSTGDLCIASNMALQEGGSDSGWSRDA